MAERDELEPRLAQARQVMVAPAALKARVLAQLLPSSSAAGDAAAVPPGMRSAVLPKKVLGERWLVSARSWLARGLPLRAVALLVALGFGAGFWLGRQPAGSGREVPVTATGVTAAPVAAPGDSAPLGNRPHLKAEQSSTAQANPAQSNPPQTVVTRLMPRPERTSAVSGRAKRKGAGPSLRASDAALSGEIALLARVERAIRSGEPRLALALLDELDRDYPVAVLSHERAAAQVLARCSLPAAREHGTSEEQAARRRAERFLGEHVASVYSDRIRAACVLASQGETRAAAQVETSNGTTSKNHPGLDTQRSEELK